TSALACFLATRAAVSLTLTLTVGKRYSPGKSLARQDRRGLSVAARPTASIIFSSHRAASTRNTNSTVTEPFLSCAAPLPGNRIKLFCHRRRTSTKTLARGRYGVGLTAH